MTGGLWVFCICVWEGAGGSRKQVGGDWVKNFVLFMVSGGCWGTENRILLIFNLLLLKFIKWFSSDKNSEVFRRWENYAKDIISTGMSSVANLVVFCFEEHWIDCFICYTIKRSTIKTSNQEFITSDESMIYFYLIVV